MHRSAGGSTASFLASRFSTALVFALLYGTALASLPLEAFLDRANYLTYATQSHVNMAHYWERGLLAFLSNEPLWLFTNIALHTIMPGEWVLRTIIFVPASTVAYVVIKQHPRQIIWLFLFLLMAQVIKNHIIHLRQGYAIALFLAGWFSPQKKIGWPLMVASAFVHTSFAFVLLIFVAVELAKTLRLSPHLQVLAAAFLGLVVGVSLPYIAATVGARQSGQYDFSPENVSGLGFLFWAALLFLMLSAGRAFVAVHTFALATIGFYLATYFQFEVTARIFESTLLLVLLSGLDLGGGRRQAFLAAIMFYTAFQYIQRAGLPYLGWGV